MPVGRLLVQLGFVSEATLRDALSEKLGLQSVDLAHIIVDPAALKMLPRDLARRYRIFPVALDRQQKKFIVALADTNNIVAVDQLRAHLKGDFEIELRLAGDSEIERAIEHYYGHEFSIDGILREIETGEVDYTTITEGDEYSQPVVRLISALLADAVERGGLRHPLRAGAELPAHPLPHRRRAAPDPLACTRPTGRRWRCASR